MQPLGATEQPSQPHAPHTLLLGDEQTYVVPQTQPLTGMQQVHLRATWHLGALSHPQTRPKQLVAEIAELILDYKLDPLSAWLTYCQGLPKNRQETITCTICL